MTGKQEKRTDEANEEAINMQITGKTLKPLTEAKYLNADNVSRYRAIMRIFLMHYDKLKYKLYQEDCARCQQARGIPTERMRICV